MMGCDSDDGVHSAIPFLSDLRPSARADHDLRPDGRSYLLAALRAWDRQASLALSIEREPTQIGKLLIYSFPGSSLGTHRLRGYRLAYSVGGLPGTHGSPILAGSLDNLCKIVRVPKTEEDCMRGCHCLLLLRKRRQPKTATRARVPQLALAGSAPLIWLCSPDYGDIQATPIYRRPSTPWKQT